MIQHTLTQFGCIIHDNTIHVQANDKLLTIITPNNKFSIHPRFMKHIHPHTHGWFSKQTQYHVEQALYYLICKSNQHCKPLRVVELGTWYGSSA